MIATGLLNFAMRVYPCCPALQAPLLQSRYKKLLDNMNDSEYNNVKHGAADYRLDRCSLCLYGPMTELYQGNERGCLFVAMFTRMVCNDAAAIWLFLECWWQASRGLLDHNT